MDGERSKLELRTERTVFQMIDTLKCILFNFDLDNYLNAVKMTSKSTRF